MSEVLDLQRERAGRNQALLREVNERIEELNETFDQFSPYGTWMCECADTGCREQIEMTIGEYEAIRRHPNRFVIAPHGLHFYENVEDVVEETARYWVVEKIGEAARVAIELDTRRD
jgi:SpoU rRNA methylase family enzyme